MPSPELEIGRKHYLASPAHHPVARDGSPIRLLGLKGPVGFSWAIKLEAGGFGLLEVWTTSAGLFARHYPPLTHHYHLGSYWAIAAVRRSFHQPWLLNHRIRRHRRPYSNPPYYLLFNSFSFSRSCILGPQLDSSYILPCHRFFFLIATSRHSFSKMSWKLTKSSCRLFPVRAASIATPTTVWMQIRHI